MAANGSSVAPTKEQRAMMAGHVGDLALRALRRGDDAVSLLEYARDLLTEEGPEDFYREALREAGYGDSAVEASFASIARGEHPSDSQPGWVLLMRASAQREIDRASYGSVVMAESLGKKFATGDVLKMLGCKVSSTEVA
jgi:hypothetical protein